jgi:hypothetical protein
MSEIFDHTRVCHLPGRCQICGGPNGCRLETGEAYKGPCWCEKPALPASALHRLMGEVADPRCLCQRCLERIEADPAVTWEQLAQPRQSLPSE